MKKTLLKFNIIFALVILAVWLLQPSLCPRLTSMCDFAFCRMQVGVYNTAKNTANAQAEKSRQVVICFDDGFACVYEYAKPVLENYDYTASIAVIGNRVGKHKYLNYKQLSILYRDGYEILNHSYSHVQNVELNNDKLTHEYTYNRLLLNLYGFRSSGDILVAPGGKYFDNHIAVVKDNDFTAVRSLDNLYITMENCNMKVSIINATISMTMDDFICLMDEANENNQDIILVFHKILDDPPQHEMFVSTELFKDMIAYLSDNDYSVVSYKELIREK